MGRSFDAVLIYGNTIYYKGWGIIGTLKSDLPLSVYEDVVSCISDGNKDVQIERLQREIEDLKTDLSIAERDLKSYECDGNY